MQGSFDAGAADAQAKTGEPEDGAGNAAVHVTFFKDYAAQRHTTEKLTLPQLQERVLNASARAKDKLPWLKLATFGSNRTGKGSLRHDANVLEINGIELDYDDEKIAFNDAAKVLALGIASDRNFQRLQQRQEFRPELGRFAKQLEMIAVKTKGSNVMTTRPRPRMVVTAKALGPKIKSPNWRTDRKPSSRTPPQRQARRSDPLSAMPLGGGGGDRRALCGDSIDDSLNLRCQ